MTNVELIAVLQRLPPDANVTVDLREYVHDIGQVTLRFERAVDIDAPIIILKPDWDESLVAEAAEQIRKERRRRR